MFPIIFSQNKHTRTPALLSVITTVAAPVDTDAAPTHCVCVCVKVCVLFRSFVLKWNCSNEGSFGAFFLRVCAFSVFSSQRKWLDAKTVTAFKRPLIQIYHFVTYVGHSQHFYRTDVFLQNECL